MSTGNVIGKLALLTGDGDSLNEGLRSLRILSLRRGGCGGLTGLSCILACAILLVSDDSALVYSVWAAQFVQGDLSCSGAALALGASLTCSAGGGLGTARLVPCQASDSLPDRVVLARLADSTFSKHEGEDEEFCYK